MTRLNDLNNDESVTGIIFGASGTGKTALLGSGGDKSLLIIPSNGLVTLKSKWFKDKYKSNPIVEIVDEQPIPDKAEGFDKVSEILEKYFENEINNFDTFCVDDCTNLRRMAMNKGFEINQKLLRSKSLEKYVKTHDVIIREQQDYNIEMALIEQFMRHWTQIAKSYKKNFFISAHERLEWRKAEKIGGEDTVLKNRPGFTGKTFPSDITGLFDLTWHAEVVGDGDRRFYQLRTEGNSIIEAKSRWAGIFPPLIEQAPSLSVIINHIKSGTPFTNKR